MERYQTVTYSQINDTINSLLDKYGFYTVSMIIDNGPRYYDGSKVERYLVYDVINTMRDEQFVRVYGPAGNNVRIYHRVAII